MKKTFFAALAAGMLTVFLAASAGLFLAGRAIDATAKAMATALRLPTAIVSLRGNEAVVRGPVRALKGDRLFPTAIVVPRRKFVPVAGQTPEGCDTFASPVAGGELGHVLAKCDT